ncbi:hypothetical protein NQ318_017661 [Aromia moschata]|uniref:DUF4817 domain-containing protein n=1 Tax=Aromia moschata TaxID=1265417 RepID=A0AAV8XNP9_9CUCU|nr:hypothetical protein NQ318_017661 [Aromia moschata]
MLVRCAQLKELLLLPKVCVKTQEPQLVTEHNNLIRTESRNKITSNLEEALMAAVIPSPLIKWYRASRSVANVEFSCYAFHHAPTRPIGTTRPSHNPITQSTVSKIESKFRETGDVKDLPKSGRPKITQDKKIDIVLSMEENLQSTSTLVTSENEVSQTTVLRILKK